MRVLTARRHSPLQNGSKRQPCISWSFGILYVALWVRDLVVHIANGCLYSRQLYAYPSVRGLGVRMVLSFTRCHDTLSQVLQCSGLAAKCFSTLLSHLRGFTWIYNDLHRFTTEIHSMNLCINEFSKRRRVLFSSSATNARKTCSGCWLKHRGVVLNEERVGGRGWVATCQ